MSNKNIIELSSYITLKDTPIIIVDLKKLFLTREHGLWKILMEEWTGLSAAELKARHCSLKR